MHGIKKYHPRSSLTFNMAPMIDVVFLLIIFFVLISTFASAERIVMELPEPDRSQARNIKLTDRVIINVQLLDPDSPETSAVGYSIGPSRPEPLGSIDERLGRYKRAVPDLKVIIRADRRVRYGDVREVMEIVAENEIEMMNIVAHVGETGGAP